MTTGFTITGAKQLQNALDTLPAKVSKKIVRKAVRVSQKIILAAAKSNAKTMVGGSMGDLIAKNLKIKSPKKQKRRQYMLLVKTIEAEQFIDISKDGRRNFIPASIEYGHGENKEQIAIPFMRKAADSNQTKAITEFKKQMQTGIDTAIREVTNAK